MGEVRKSDFVGDVFGEWTVVGKADAQGDRKRRWVVQSAEGTQMTVEQVNLKDLALAKKLKDKAEQTDLMRALKDSIPVLAQDESNVFENAFTLTEAEADLYRRLDNQIADAASVAEEAEVVPTENAFEDDGYPGNPDYELAKLTPEDGELSATTPESKNLTWVTEAGDALVQAKAKIVNYENGSASAKVSQEIADELIKAKVQINKALALLGL